MGNPPCKLTNGLKFLCLLYVSANPGPRSSRRRIRPDGFHLNLYNDGLRSRPSAIHRHRRGSATGTLIEHSCKESRLLLFQKARSGRKGAVRHSQYLGRVLARIRHLPWLIDLDDHIATMFDNCSGRSLLPVPGRVFFAHLQVSRVWAAFRAISLVTRSQIR